MRISNHDALVSGAAEIGELVDEFLGAHADLAAATKNCSDFLSVR